MRRATRAIATAGLLLALAAAPQAQDAETPRWHGSFQEDVQFFSDLAARGEESTMEWAAAQHIRGRLAVSGMRPRLHALTEPFGESRSAIVDVAVAGRRDDTLLIVVPLALADAPDSPPHTDGPTLALILGFARFLAQAPERPPVSVRFLFLGGERGDPDHGYPFGSRSFLQEYLTNAPTAVLYFDLIGRPGSVQLHTGGDRVVAPPWLVRGVLSALQGAGQPVRIPAAHANDLVRLGLAEEPRLAPFFRAGHPALRLSGHRDAAGAGADPDLWLARMAQFLVLLTAEYEDGIPAAWDRNYLLLGGTTAPLIVAEQDYVVLVVLAIAAVIFYAFAASTQLRYATRTLWQYGWRIPLMGAVAVAALGAGSAALGLLPRAARNPLLWHEAPVLFLALKLGLAALVAALAHYEIGRRWLEQDRRAPIASFYLAAAAVMLLVVVAAAAAVNVALAYPFVWALLCVLLANLARNRWHSLLWIVLAPVWIVRLVASLYLQPAQAFVALTLFAPLSVDLVAAALLLPMVLLGRATLVSFFGYRNVNTAYRRQLWRRLGIALLVALIGVGSAVALSLGT
ncbi:MAG: M28 family peptidase, partial [Spirochaetaceae bacterium]|nr:M28 family peptidase [Spirochaetaceae bacterium]